MQQELDVFAIKVFLLDLPEHSRFSFYALYSEAVFGTLLLNPQVQAFK